MVNAYAPVKSGGPGSFSIGNAAPGLLTFLFIAFFVYLGVSQIRPPETVPNDAPLTEFSSGRAMQHLREIAQDPHPMGSAEHGRIRDYILKELTALGLEPETQKATVVNHFLGPPFPSATVENILARIKGTGGDKAVLLVSHYDSVPISPGASDDGSSVAALLETSRALKASAPPKNDVVFLFTDGEEPGLLGAKAFVDEHPWAKNIGLVLNFEARGNRGPAMMFETSAGNGWLISEFAKAAPYPIANSLSYEVYKRLPNDTDLTMFKESGFSCLNFAYIDGLNHYHTPLDNIDSIDERSLQHHGSYALALARHFGDLDLEAPKAADSVYFNIFRSSLIHYSGKWVAPLAILVVLIFVCVAAIGLRRGRLSWSGIGLGFCCFLLSMIAAPLAVTIAWGLIRALHGGYNSHLQEGTYNSPLYMASFVALTVAVISSLFILFRKKISVENLTAGALVWWLILMIVSWLVIPGGSYLFTWPLLFTLIGMGFLFVSKDRASTSTWRSALLLICAIPAIMLFASMIYMLFTGLSMGVAGMLMVPVVLLLGLLIPQLDSMTSQSKWLLPAASLLLCLGLIVAGALRSGFYKEHPRPDSLFYALSADSGRAVWSSVDEQPDEWTSQFFSAGAERGAMAEYLPSNYKGFLKSEAPAVSLPAPSLVLLEDKKVDDARVLRLRVTSPRGAPVILIYLESNGRVQGSSINGKQILRPASRWGVNYYALPQEGMVLAVRVASSEPIKIRATDLSYGLPEIPDTNYAPKPDHVMPSPFPYDRTTLVSKSFTF